MDSRTRIFVGYLLIFGAGYLGGIAYTILPTAVNFMFDSGFKLPQSGYTVAMNATSSIASVSSWFPTLALLLAAVVVMSLLMGSFGMRYVADGSSD